MQHQLPQEGFLRLWQILGDQENPAILPISRSTWYAGIRKGIYPKPCRLSARTSAWRVDDIRNLVQLNHGDRNNGKQYL